MSSSAIIVSRISPSSAIRKISTSNTLSSSKGSQSNMDIRSRKGQCRKICTNSHHTVLPMFTIEIAVRSLIFLKSVDSRCILVMKESTPNYRLKNGQLLNCLYLSSKTNKQRLQMIKKSDCHSNQFRTWKNLKNKAKLRPILTSIRKLFTSTLENHPWTMKDTHYKKEI